MASKEITLGSAAFLDSAPARALVDLRDQDVRRIVEIFLASAYEDLGKKPRLLDGEDVALVLVSLMPARMKPKDPLAEHVPAVLAAYLDHLEETEVVAQIFEIRSALDRGLEGFRAAVRSGSHAGQARERQDPLVHRAPRLGRNDPCFCGSGKKFKKCHGRGA